MTMAVLAVAAQENLGALLTLAQGSCLKEFQQEVVQRALVGLQPPAAASKSLIPQWHRTG
jgi:hypothetical protein